MRSLERAEYTKVNAAGLLYVRCDGGRHVFVILNAKIEKNKTAGLVSNLFAMITTLLLDL